MVQAARRVPLLVSSSGRMSATLVGRAVGTRAGTVGETIVRLKSSDHGGGFGSDAGSRSAATELIFTRANQSRAKWQQKQRLAVEKRSMRFQGIEGNSLLSVSPSMALPRSLAS